MNHGYASSYGDRMDIDEQIMNDVATLRASNWDASSESTFVDISTHTDVSESNDGIVRCDVLKP
jgi:hypothetical protein